MSSFYAHTGAIHVGCIVLGIRYKDLISINSYLYTCRENTASCSFTHLYFFDSWYSASRLPSHAAWLSEER